MKRIRPKCLNDLLKYINKPLLLISKEARMDTMQFYTHRNGHAWIIFIRDINNLTKRAIFNYYCLSNISLFLRDENHNKKLNPSYETSEASFAGVFMQGYKSTTPRTVFVLNKKEYSKFKETLFLEAL